MTERTSVIMRLIFSVAFGYTVFAAVKAVVNPSVVYAGSAGVASIVLAWMASTVVVFLTLTYGERALGESQIPIAKGIDTSYDIAEMGIMFGVGSNVIYWLPEVLGQGGHPSVLTVLAVGVGTAAAGKSVLLYRGRHSQSASH